MPQTLRWCSGPWVPPGAGQRLRPYAGAEGPGFLLVQGNASDLTLVQRALGSSWCRATPQTLRWCSGPWAPPGAGQRLRPYAGAVGPGFLLVQDNASDLTLVQWTMGSSWCRTMPQTLRWCSGPWVPPGAGRCLRPYAGAVGPGFLLAQDDTWPHVISV